MKKLTVADTNIYRIVSLMSFNYTKFILNEVFPEEYFNTAEPSLFKIQPSVILYVRGALCLDMVFLSFPNTNLEG